MEDYYRYIGHQHQPFSTRAHLAAIKYRVPMDKIETIKEVDPNIWKHKKRHNSLNQHLHKSDCPLLLLNEAKRMIQSYPGLVPFYTDGSNKSNKTGAGVASRRYNGGWRLPNYSSIFDAELFAIFSTLEHIDTHRLSSVIFSDSQSALSDIKSGTSKHPYALKINHQIAEATYRICLAWVPAHIGIKGNEKADAWAKRSISYPRTTSCAISPKTMKRTIDISITKYWQDKWTSTNIKNKFKIKINPLVTECRPLRREEIVLCRLRTDATMLTHMVPYIERRYPPICEECNEICTIKHILVDCISYIRERRELLNHFRSIGKRMSAFSLLQDDPEIIDKLMKFLRNTDLIKIL